MANRSTKEYCGYVLWCPECGYKTAAWVIDSGHDATAVKETFDMQFRDFTFPAHAEHGTFTFVKICTFKNEHKLIKALEEAKL